MTTQSKSTGFIIALIGGVVALIAFFAMPFVTAFNYLSATAPQLISLATQYSSSSYSTSSNGQAVVILWLAPVLAGVAALLAALQFRSTAQASSKRAAGGWLLALGILGALFYLGILLYINSLFYNSSSSSYNGPSVFSFLGAGFWIYVISMVGVIVGGAMGLSATKSAPFIAVPPTPFSTYQQPPTQYPPYQQQQPPPQYPPSQQPWSPPPQFPPSPHPPGSSKWPPTQPQ